jgi:uridine phosphorylase
MPESEGKDVEKESVYENTNGMPMANGKNLHMDTGPGDMGTRPLSHHFTTTASPLTYLFFSLFFSLAHTYTHAHARTCMAGNLIVNVGSLGRAEIISTLLTDVTRISSSRGFTTFTGTFKGKKVSVVAIGMGVAMMDFFVRETRAVVSGPLVTIRYGTCGGVSTLPSAGSVVVVERSGLLTRDPDAFAHLYDGSAGGAEPATSAYRWSALAPADAALTDRLEACLKDSLGVDGVSIGRGVNVTADSFYGSQGRVDHKFLDANATLIDETRAHYSKTTGQEDAIQSMEMEAFQLLHLAKCATPDHPIIAAAAAIVVADRATSTVIDDATLKTLELNGGRAVLEALTSIQVPGL